jgi:hypothetical protein
MTKKKTNRQTEALILASSQCLRLSQFLCDFSARLDEKPATALTAKEAQAQSDDIGGLLFEVANLLDLTAKGCNFAAGEDQLK